jgi:ABC-type polar amino acid transport system ATPase subunit
MKRNILINRLCAIENLRDMRGDWIAATWNAIRLFPKDGQGRINRFIEQKNAENAKKLLEALEKMRVEMLTLLTAPAQTVGKGDMIDQMVAAKSQYLNQIREQVMVFDQSIAQLNFELVASVLNTMWKLIDEGYEE